MIDYFSSVSIDIEEECHKGGTMIFKMGTISECLQDLTVLGKHPES